MISFSCPSCQMKLTVKPEFAGRSSRCPSCKQPLTVPSLDTTHDFVPPQRIDGEESSLARIGQAGGVTLEPGAVGRQPTSAEKPQRPLSAVLAGQNNGKERYVIEGEIARGGMGAVLRAVDGDLRRKVAVKYMLDEKDPTKKARFIEEAQINAQLEHPNIVPVYDLRIDPQGRPYLIMKLVKGRDLKGVLDQLRENLRQAEKEWTLGRLLNILVGVCNGLAFAHAHGVVHRDLKPANIMLGDFGEVYVMDWGLAKVLRGADRAGPVSEAEAFAAAMGGSGATPARSSSKVVTSRELEADMTQEGAIMGTPVYMPPEQALGNIQAIDQRSDVYSLGALLYEMLALQPPIDKEGGYLAILQRVAMGEITSPEQRDPKRAREGKVPRELAAIAMKALAKEPDRRYSNVGALRQDIERFQEGRSVSAKEDTFKEMAWKLVKRNKGLSAGMAATFLILLCSLWFTGKAYLRANEAVDRMTAAEVARQKQGRDSVPSLVRAARLLTSEKQFDDALTQLDTTLRFDDRDADAHLLRGQLLIGEQRYEEAFHDLTACLKVRPGDDRAAPLAKLCEGTRPDQGGKLLALAGELDRQKMFSISTRVTQQAEKVRGARNELLALYRKRIDSAWPGLGGRLTLDDRGVHISLEGQSERVRDLTPLAGMKLTTLNLAFCEWITDLTPLQGLPLKELSLNGCKRVQDFTPLRTLPLAKLDLTKCSQVLDLTPFQGMSLATLILTDCSQVRDLTPLKGMPLTTLNVGGQHGSTQVQDLTPLRGMALTALDIGATQVRDLTPLKGMPLTWLNLEFLRQVQDLTPLKGMPLTWLNLDRTGVRDLTLLKGMPLTVLNFALCAQVRDLEPLRGMALKELWMYGTGVTDLRPLQGMALEHISLTPTNITQGMEIPRDMKSLKTISTNYQRGSPPAAFWAAFEKGEFKK